MIFLQAMYHEYHIFLFKDAYKSEMAMGNNCVLQSTDEKYITLNYVKKILSKMVSSNLYKLFQVAFTIHKSFSTCKKSFSAMRRMKT